MPPGIDISPVFDGQIGDTPAGVDLISPIQSTGGAGHLAAVAGTTMIKGKRGIGREFCREQNLPQKEVGAFPLENQIGVFSDPAQTGFHRQGLFHDRKGIHADPTGGSGNLFLNKIQQPPEFFPQHFVIIPPPGIKGNISPIRRKQDGFILPIVVLGHHDDRLSLGKKASGIGAFPAGTGHPVHGAMQILSDPLLQAPTFLLQGFRIANACSRKAQTPGERFDVIHEVHHIFGLQAVADSTAPNG